MASSNKFNLSSGSPDRPLYPSGSRGSHIAGSVDRSVTENPILSSLPSMSRTTSTVTHGDVTNFLQCLRFDPKSMASEYKFNRYGDFRRLASAALGAPDGSPSGLLKGKPHSFSPEDLKRLRAGLRESTIKARERVKIFSESLSVVNKCFPSIPSRKRSRPDGLSGDRTVMGGGVGKMGTQNHGPTGVFDFEQHKVEVRGKNSVPNKRTRTSMVDQRVDVRPNTPARSTASVDRDKEVLRTPNSNGPQGEDRALSIVGDGWEKAKMKKKRSVIKAEAASSPSSGSTKPDGYREPKQGIHPRHFPDARSRLTDSYAVRAGAANGVTGAGKADRTRSSIPKPDQETTSLLHDKRDMSNSSEQERTNVRVVNKMGVRDEFISGSPTSTKLHANARGPRSGSTIVLPKLSPVVQQAATSNDWGLPHGTSKNPINRKRTLSTRSSSPPVAQWADRRPQKISRTARRTNLVPVVSATDETPLDSPRQSKSKCDHTLSSSLSESEESGAAEFRIREKGKKCDELEDKSGQNVQKMSNLVLPARKNKLVNGEARIDGVRRQGRTGRGFGSARFSAPTTGEKLHNVGTAKHLRTAKHSFDKSESKLGRPPTRKLSDRKAYTRQKHTAVNTAPDFLDDGHEELLAAQRAVINPSHALSSPFWRQMESFFGFLSDIDTSFIKRQESISSTVTTTKSVLSDVDNSYTLVNGMDNGNLELNPEPLPPRTPSPQDIPLCQRLLAALITEENNEPTCSGNDKLNINVYGSRFEFETDIESKVFNPQQLQNLELSGHDAFSGYYINSMQKSCNERVHNLSDNHIISTNERLLLEIQSIGLYPQLVPGSAHTGEGDITRDICDLENKYHEKFFRKKSLLDKLLKTTTDIRQLQEMEFEQHSFDELTEMAYQKYMSCWGPNAPGGKSAGSKFAKQAALAFVKRTLDRCQEFETTGKSCFTKPLFREMFVSGPSHSNDSQLYGVTDADSGQLYGNSTEVVSGTQLSPSLNNQDIYFGAKGKRSEKDKEWKGNNGYKVGRPTTNNTKGERKTKTKLKQKTTQFSASISGSQFKISDQHKPTVEVKISDVKENDQYEEPLDFSHLQIPDMDVLGDDFGEQGQDIGSWLNIDDEVLQDDDFMGLEIPMDDLTDLNMMV